MSVAGRACGGDAPRTRPDPRGGIYRDGLFDGHVALVAPAVGGPAVETVALLAALGARVALLVPDAAAGAAALPAGLPADRSVVHVGDPRRPEVAEAALATAWARFGALDTLVTCGLAPPGAPRAAVGLPTDDWLRTVDAELNATWYLMHAAARRWRDADRGGNIAALIHPFRPARPGEALECATGASVAHLAKTVAVEWAPYRLRVNCVAPVDASPRQVAEAVAWLSAASGKFVTGETMWLARPPAAKG